MNPKPFWTLKNLTVPAAILASSKTHKGVVAQAQYHEPDEARRGVGLTFQQTQKYEKGANRIGAGRLQQFLHG
jgi:hypothetical protein